MVLATWTALACTFGVGAAQDGTDLGAEGDSVVVFRRPVAPALTNSSSATGTAPDEALSDHMQGLSRQTDSDFGLDALSISDAEVDSLIRLYDETGQAPSLDAGPARWRVEAGLSGVRYNRVEGLNVMPRVAISTPTNPVVETFGRVGWGLASEELTWRAGVRVPLPGVALPTLSYTYAHDVYSYGSGGIPGNSATALTLGRDYYDYYLGDGWSADASYVFGRARARVGFRSEDQSSLPLETDFSLFERPADFRPNPLVNRGRDRIVETALTFGSDVSRWTAGAFASVARDEFGGDFEYESYRAEIGARRTVWFGDLATIRVSAGTVTGEPPYQALHFLGGFQALRGYEVNEFSTRRFAHGRLDYRLGTDVMGWIPFARHLRLQLAPFFDAATIFETQDLGGMVVEHDRPEARFAAGLGVQRNVLGLPGGGGQLRLDIARRLDRADDAWTFRLGITAER
jgi:hypothetical protein